MIKRLFWFSLGVGFGVFATWRVTRTVRTTVERYLPEPVVTRMRALNDAIEERQRLIRAQPADAKRELSFQRPAVPWS